MDAWDKLVQWLREDGSVISNALGIWGGVFAGAAFIFAILRRRLRSTTAINVRLQEEADAARKKRDEALTELQKLQTRLKGIERRQPRNAVAKSQKERLSGNDLPARWALLEWLEYEGDDAGTLFSELAEWYVDHSYGDSASVACSIAEHYAAASVACSPISKRSETLLKEIRSWRQLESWTLSPLESALRRFADLEKRDPGSDDTLDDAQSFLNRSRTAYSAGHFRMAALFAQAAKTRFRRLLGEDSRSMFAAMTAYARALERLGRSDVAVEMLDKVVSFYSSNEQIGRFAEDTLRARWVRALALKQLGRLKEAHSEIEAIIDDAASSGHAFGASFIRNIHGTRSEIEFVQSDYVAALKSAEFAASVPGEGNPLLGYLGQVTAKCLIALGRNEEAIKILQPLIGGSTIKIGETRDSFVLFNNFWMSRALINVGDNVEAVKILSTLVDIMKVHEDMGPDHRETLVNQQTLAKALCRSGREGEAKTVIDDTLERMSNHPEFGPDHPEIANALLVKKEIETRLQEVN